MAPVMVLLVWIATRVTAQLCGSGQVVELDDSSFNAAVSQCHHILVDFYAPWCSHCKALSPQLDEVATSAPTELPQLTVAKINADKYTSISSKYKISEYPTIKLFIDGVQINYDGPHKAELMLAHLKKLMAPEITYLSAPSDFDNFLRQAGIHFPIFIAFGLQGSTPFLQLARRYQGRAWFALFNVEDSNSKHIMVTYGLNQLPALQVHHFGQQYEDQRVFYGPFQADSLTNFVKHNLLPTLTSLSFDNLKAVKDDGRPILLVITNTSSSPAVLDQLKTLAGSHTDFVFALLNSSFWPVLAANFNNQKLLIWTGQSEYYTSAAQDDSEEQTLTEQIVNLVQDFRDNKARRNLIKRPPLIEQVAGFLGQNFLYVILFIVTVVASLQGMNWNEPRPTNVT